MDRIAGDVVDLKMRQSSVETGMVLMKREVALGDETDARQQLILDRLSDRIERIERRLDLIGG